jgi:hypothetical protein
VAKIRVRHRFIASADPSHPRARAQDARRHRRDRFIVSARPLLEPLPNVYLVPTFHRSIDQDLLRWCDNRVAIPDDKNVAGEVASGLFTTASADRYPRWGAVFPDTFVPVLTIEGKCRLYRGFAPTIPEFCADNYGLKEGLSLSEGV